MEKNNERIKKDISEDERKILERRKEQLKENYKDSLEEFKILSEIIDKATPELEMKSEKRERISAFLNFHHEKELAKYSKNLAYLTAVLVILTFIEIHELLLGKEATLALIEDFKLKVIDIFKIGIIIIFAFLVYNIFSKDVYNISKDIWNSLKKINIKRILKFKH